MEEKATILSQIADEKGIHDNAVEKDFWVSMVLRAVFTQPYATRLCFKGGTSLSKGWNLIARFSEDIDLAIDREFLGFEGEISRRDLRKLRRKSKTFVEQVLAYDVEQALALWGLAEQCRVVVPETSVSDKDPAELYLEYDSILPHRDAYMPERVKLEVSCRSMMEPCTTMALSSMIEEAYPDEDFALAPVDVPTVNPERTFLEKIFLLHEEFNRPNGCTHLDRLTRHMYDIEKMMDLACAQRALHDKQLYMDIIRHRSSFTAWSGLDYHSHEPATISFLPPEHVLAELKDDYRKMQEYFIFGETCSFETLLDRLRRLQERLRQL